MVPLIGAPADLANAGLYAAEGDRLNAGISMLGVVPVVGEAATATKWGVKAEKGVEAAYAASKPSETAKAGEAFKTAKSASLAAKGESTVYRQAEAQYGAGSVSSQTAFKEGQMVAGRPKGSSVPDTTVFLNGKVVALEVKTYGTSSLKSAASSVAKQTDYRQTQLPPGSRQELIIVPKNGEVTLQDIDRFARGVATKSKYLSDKDISVLFKPSPEGSLNGFLRSNH